MSLRRQVMGTVIVLMFLIAVQAKAIPLSELITTNGSLAVDDLVFNRFRFAVSPLTTPGSIPTTASGINVSGMILNGEPGLQFTGNFFAPPGGTLSVVFGYDVSVTEPLDVLRGLTVSGDPRLIGSGQLGIGSSAAVLTSALRPNGSGIGVNISHQSPQQSGIFTSLLPVVQVDSNVTLTVTGEPNLSAAVSFINQTFSQTTVPEPSSVALLSTGLVALLRVLRRKTS